MKFIVAIFRWIWKAVSFLLPVMPGLYGLVVIAAFVGAVSAIYIGTRGIVDGIQSNLMTFSDGVVVSIQGVFQALRAHSLGNVLCYCLSLDYPFRWLASAGEFIITVVISGTIGILIAGVESALLVVGIYFVRKRVGSMVAGLGGGGSSE